MELENNLRLMHRDGVLTMAELQIKLKLLADNIDLIEEAIQDPEKSKELEYNLGIVKQQLYKIDPNLSQL